MCGHSLGQSKSWHRNSETGFVGLLCEVVEAKVLDCGLNDLVKDKEILVV